MRMLRWVLPCALLLWVLPACEDDGDGRPDDGSRIDQMGDDAVPTGGDDVDPTGPGLEPPATGNGGADPMAPSDGVDTGSSGGTGGDTTSTPGSMDGDGDGGEEDAGGDDPCAGAACGAGNPCADASLHCIALPSCSGQAHCMAVADACQLECGTTECGILESYPEQVSCP